MYQVILADPPWAYRVYGKSLAAQKSRAAEAHYRTMSISDLASLPVQDMASKDAALFLWVTSPCLPDGLEIMKAWGFKYKTIAFDWVKLDKAGKPKMGMGFYTRSEAEICLLGTRGKLARQSAAVRQVILAPAREHSRKPDETYRRIMQLYAGPYLELFARQQWPGWDTQGNEIDKFTVSIA